jgi:Zn-dependent metalloprotease
MDRHLPSVCSIIPPHILSRIAEDGDSELRESALRSLATSAAIRARRAALAPELRRLGVNVADLAFLAPTHEHHNRVYDVNHGGDSDLPGDLKRSDQGPAAKDSAVNDAFDGAEKTYQFYRDVFSRESVDGEGLELVSSVHFDVRLDNAFWNGAQMCYGDGGGGMILPDTLTGSLDVIGHELTHGVTQYSANLNYRKQSGALNESFSDVFGSLVKQYSAKQSAAKADWLIGEGIMTPAMGGTALRSMKAPGTAFKFDNQPATMDDYVDLPDDGDPRHDNGGVHINSGIPNHAFYLAAVALGGNAWETVGPIWYDALTTRLKSDAQFTDAAAATIASAEALKGKKSPEADAVRSAWADVKVDVVGSTA